MFFRIKKSGPRQYLQLVENRWEDGRSKQKALVTLGRVDQLRDSGQLDAMLASGSRFSETLTVLSEHAKGTLPAVSSRSIGPAKIFGRLWEQTDKLQKRFGIRNVCVVADRGMIQKTTLASLEELGIRYILGARMRAYREIRDEVLSRPGRFRKVERKATGTKQPSPLEVKEVFVEDRRYIVCRNSDQARKDAHDREAILASLEDRLSRGSVKSMVANRGYRKYLKTVANGTLALDAKKIEREKRFDGKWVLRTNADLDAAEVALAYKQLWVVEHMFRSMKSLLSTRPIYHKRDETIRGHVFCSFLALLLRHELRARLDAKDMGDLEWAPMLRDLGRVRLVEVESGDKRYRLRTETPGAAGKVFQACGVALPRTVEQVL